MASYHGLLSRQWDRDEAWPNGGHAKLEAGEKPPDVFGRGSRRTAADDAGFEAAFPTHYTYATIHYVTRRLPGARFVWVMGADNLATFDRWQNWRGIASLVPIVVVDRLGPSLYAAASPAGQALAKFRFFSLL